MIVIDLRGGGSTSSTGGTDPDDTTLTYDSDGNGVVDNSETVDGHTVELDIGVTPVSTLQATDDMADVANSI